MVALQCATGGTKKWQDKNLMQTIILPAVRRATLSALCFLALLINIASALDRSSGSIVAGINIAGGEFAAGRPRINIDYRYPLPAELDYFIAKGFRLFRVPFTADRVLVGRRSETDISRDNFGYLEAVIDHAAAHGVTIVLDMHDYGLSRHQQAIGVEPEATNTFVRDWSVLAKHVKSKPNVVIGLMNEPHVQTPAQWAAAANKAIAAIRASGATNLILVSGGAWATAARWRETGNHVAMQAIHDPLNRYMIEVHQYLDPDHAGKTGQVARGVGATRLVEFTNWARARGVRAFLGEFGWADNPESHAEGRALLGYMAQNSDVWAGWAAWAAGKWWGDYLFSLEPRNGKDSPTLNVIEEFMPVSQLHPRPSRYAY